jgi:predicted component of type VI protein secretion system
MDQAMQPAGEMGCVLPELANNAPGERDVPADFIPLRLVVKPGGMAMELNRPDMLVGRHSEADVRLALPDVSRRHCRLVFSNGGWQVVDLNSLNGVFVNGERIIQAELHDHDIIGIGVFRFEVDMGSERAEAQRAPAEASEAHQALSVTHLAMRFEEQRKAS